MDAIAIIYSDVPFSPFQRGYANLDVMGSSPNTLYHNVSFLFLPSSGFAFLLICLLCSPLIAVTPNVSIREYLRLGPVRLPRWLHSSAYRTAPSQQVECAKLVGPWKMTKTDLNSFKMKIKFLLETIWVINFQNCLFFERSLPFT